MLTFIKVSIMSYKTLPEMSSVLYQNRYCDQEDFDLIVSSELTDYYYNNEAIIHKIDYPGLTKAEEVYCNSTFSENDKDNNVAVVCKIKCPGFTNDGNAFPSFKFDTKDKILPYKSSALAVCRKRETYYADDDFGYSFAKLFGNSSNEFKTKGIFVPRPDFVLYSYCACSFMKNLYVFNCTYSGNSVNVKYDTIKRKWRYIAKINIGRSSAGCAVFKGKIVVSGTGSEFKTVEAYDYYRNKWSRLPDMIEGRSSHGSVGLGNKLFVIGGYYSRILFTTSSCEVFDSNSNVFTQIKSKFFQDRFRLGCCQVVSVGFKIVVFATFSYKSGTKDLYIYDVLKGQWSLEEIKMSNNKKIKCCTKVPVV